MPLVCVGYHLRDLPPCGVIVGAEGAVCVTAGNAVTRYPVDVIIVGRAGRHVREDNLGVRLGVQRVDTPLGDRGRGKMPLFVDCARHSLPICAVPAVDAQASGLQAAEVFRLELKAHIDRPADRAFTLYAVWSAYFHQALYWVGWIYLPHHHTG